MSVYSVKQECTSTVPAHRLYAALVTERHVVLPKMMPQIIKGMEVIHGDGGVGTITRSDFTEAVPYRYLKQRIDELDKKNLYCKLTCFEGESLAKKFGVESTTYEIKFEATSEGSKGYQLIHYNLKPGLELNKVEADAAKVAGINLFKKVEDYLLANPDLYA